MNIEELLRQAEGKTLEFRSALTSRERLLKTVVALANTSGGAILFGVEDRTRRVTGVNDPLKVEGQIANVVSEGVRPRIVPDIEIIPWRRTHIVAVRVFPSPLRPHHVKALGSERGVFVRVGSSNRPADRPLIEEMRRFAGLRAFDEEPMPGLDSEDLDFRAASELFAPARRLTRQSLVALGLLVRHQDRLVPTVGGVLLFGRERTSHFPDAYLQAGRFAGPGRSRILDSAEFRSPLPLMVEHALGFVRKHEAVALEIAGARNVEHWPVPLPALREAIVNAIVHADYAQRGAPIRVSLFDERIEVENPGLLPFGLTVEDILRGVSKVRNRIIARVFKELGYIEQWGSGIGRMREACRAAGLPEPHFEEVGWHFRVTLYKTPAAPAATDPIETAILEFLKDGQGRTTAEVARIIRRTPRATRTRLATLVKRGLVAEVGTGPRDPKRRYYLAKREG